MGMYHEHGCNTPEDPTEYPTNCYNCNEDCMGIFLELLREVEL